MKDSINFFPQEAKVKKETQSRKIIRLGSLAALGVFLVFNLLLFGLYFLEKKETGDALLKIDRQEKIIKSLAQTEELYNQLKQKLSFLTNIWRDPSKVNAGLVFVNGFMGPEASLEKMNFDQDGLIALDLFSLDSSGMELFLNRSHREEQGGKIKELKIDSVKKDSSDKKLGYKFILNFKLGEK